MCKKIETGIVAAVRAVYNKIYHCFGSVRLLAYALGGQIFQPHLRADRIHGVYRVLPDIAFRHLLIEYFTCLSFYAVKGRTPPLILSEYYYILVTKL